jgi:hypothetical protein
MASRRALVTGAVGSPYSNPVFNQVAFAEFTEVYQIESDFEARVKSEFDRMIDSVAAGKN